MAACPFHPPFSFPSCGKENGPWTVQKKRPLFTALRCSGPPRDGGLPSRCRQRLSAFCQLAPDRSVESALRRVSGAAENRSDQRMAPASVPAAAPWSREGRPAAATAQPFAALPPYGCGVPLAGKIGADGIRDFPGLGWPQGPGVSVPDCRAGVPTIPRRRQEVCAGADRPAEHFFFSTGRGAFSF